VCGSVERRAAGIVGQRVDLPLDRFDSVGSVSSTSISSYPSEWMTIAASSRAGRGLCYYRRLLS